MDINHPHHAEKFKTIEAGELVRRQGGHFEQFHTVGVGRESLDEHRARF
jgi:hypothetical protein